MSVARGRDVTMRGCGGGLGARPRLVVAVTVALACLGWAPAVPQQAVAYSFPNQEVADKALSYTEGSDGGQCKGFATGMVVDEVLRAHGLPVLQGYGAVDGCYYGAYRDGGGTQVGSNDGRPGDLIQTIPKGYRTSDDPPWDGLHTAIIVGVNGPGDYKVRDSNWNLDEKIRTHDWKPDDWSGKSEVFLWRFGADTAPPFGQIAFIRGGDIWLMNSDGSGQRRLTTTAAKECQPAWSPDGKRLAYLRGDKPWLMNADGSGQRRVPFKLGRIQMPWDPGGYVDYWLYWVGAIAWSPDGKYLTLGANVFRAGRIMATSSTATRLFRVRPDGSGQQAISPVRQETGSLGGQIRHLSWKPDGGRLLVTMWARGATELAVFNPKTRAYSTPYSKLSVGYGLWSPSGRRIAASSPDDMGIPSRARLLSIDAASRQCTVLLQTENDIGDPSGLWATWSPDGQWVACAVTQWNDSVEDFASDLRILPAEGGTAWTVARDVEEPAWRPADR